MRDPENWLSKQIGKNDLTWRYNQLDYKCKEDYKLFGGSYDRKDGTRCQGNQIIIGYIPALFYSNMFSLAFLEIKSLTKISNTKASSDWKMGCSVNLVIFLSYFLVFTVFLIGFMTCDPNDKYKQQMMTSMYNSFMTMPDPFARTYRQMNIFDLTYFITFVMMFV